MLLDQISAALRLHMAIEEKLVYPAAGLRICRRRGRRRDGSRGLRIVCAVVRHCLEMLEATAPNDRRFVVRAKNSGRKFSRHTSRRKRAKLFPELEGKLARDGIQRLGDLVERRLHEIESESREVALRRARLGPRRHPVPRATRTARAGCAAAQPRRGAATEDKAIARKRHRLAGRTSRRAGGASETNGKKPRRGESTSRS